ncbi:MAG: GntR family transcriptional regulator [Bacteroidales bacterium]|nr:GntR family transcriptional regulator [Bacteroidales bacterium]MCM1147236.1 GntR family transcriptional regulator [Bacteroidales bacterium]MCM1207203.1 GntR family transcriptional regulator [Bacillota bacterium]
MEMFNKDRPIYLQISDRICDEILSGAYGDDQRIPSVRDYATLMQVNINTVMKTYEELSRSEIIYQRRGMGYFVTAGAKDAILRQRKDAFLHKTLTEMFRQMRLLGISIYEVVKEYRASSEQKQNGGG